MFDLSRRWPEILTGKSIWLKLLGLVVLLAVIAPFDVQIAQWAISWPPALLGFFAYITDYGLSDWILVPSGVLTLLTLGVLLALRSRLHKLAVQQLAQLSGFIFVGVGLPGLLTNIVKRIVGRSRPGIAGDGGAFGFEHFFNSWAYQSFPSGHTTTAFATALVVGFLAPRLYPLALIYAVAIGISRLAIGAHFATDAIVGGVVGTLGAYLVRHMFAWRRWLFAPDRQGRIRRRPFAAIKRLFRHPAAAR